MAFLCLISPATRSQSTSGVSRQSLSQLRHDRLLSAVSAAANEHSLPQRFLQAGVGLVADDAASVCEVQLQGITYLACLSG